MSHTFMCKSSPMPVFLTLKGHGSEFYGYCLMEGNPFGTLRMFKTCRAGNVINVYCILNILYKAKETLILPYLLTLCNQFC